MAMDEWRIGDYKLCLVKEETAWFTTQDVREQWGDDWNDAPWYCNAGSPYRYHATSDAARGKGPWDVLKVKWEGPFQTDATYDSRANWHSAQFYNERGAPWLKTDWISETYSTAPHIEVWAGCPLPAFVEMIEAGGGTVFLPFALAIRFVRESIGPTAE